MKKYLFIFLALLLSLPAIARDFTYEYEGQTITYTVIDEDAKTCMTRQGSGWGAGNNVSGNLILPEHPYDGVSEFTLVEIGELSFGLTKLKSVTIPNTVTTIGRQAFSHCPLTNVNLGNSVTSIGHSAFESCNDLLFLTIPNSVTTICSEAFLNCEWLWEINLGNSVTSIGHSAFAGCKRLSSITIPNSVKTIESRAFNGCNILKSITIPSSVSYIGSDAFSGCKTLTLEDGPEELSLEGSCFSDSPLEKLYLGRNLIYNAGPTNPDLRPFSSNMTNLTDLTISDSVTNIGYNLFYGCSGLTSVNIPNSVTSINTGAFAYCSGLNSVSIGNSVKSIGRSAFAGCTALTSIEVPNSVTSIDTYAFDGCTNLVSINLSNAVETIGPAAFHDCSALTSITIPNSVNAIQESTFRGCISLSSVTIGNSVKTICKLAFYDCSALMSITIPGSVTSIEDDSFDNCSSLKELTIEDGETILTLGSSIKYSGNNIKYSGLFLDCPIEKIYLGRNLDYQLSPFHGKITLKELTLGNSVSLIGNNLFNSCEQLTSVIIPNSVTLIGIYAFSNCKSLTNIYIEDGDQVLNFETDYNNCTTFNYSPITKLHLGRNLNYGSNSPFCYNYNYNDQKNLQELTIGNTVTLLGDLLFRGCSKLNNVKIPNSVTAIGASAFAQCSALTDIEFSNSITKIGASAFAQCSALTALEIPNSVTEIGESAFSGCTNLSHVVISNSLNSINKGVFQSCSSLNNVVIPNSINTIEMSAFEGCSGLTDLTLEHSYTEIIFMPKAFEGTKIENLYMGRDWSYDRNTLSSNLKTLTFSKSVKNIPESAFSGSNQLTELTFPASIETIGKEAFKDCTGLITTDFPSLENLFRINFGDKTANPLFYSHQLSIEGEEVTELVIPDNITEIGSFALCGGTRLSSVVIPWGVAAIGESAFEGCSDLSTVVIPGSVKTIGQRVFANCTGLIKSAYPASIGNPFEHGVQICYPADGIEEDGIIYDATKEKVFFAPLSYKGDYTSPSSVRSIGEKAFYLCNDLTSLSLTKCNINNMAFSNCEGLTSLSLAKCDINNMAFSNCEGLTSIRLTGDINFNGNTFWKDCPNIKEVYYITGKPRETDSNSFDQTVYENATLHLRESTREEAIGLTPWKLFDDVENIPSFAYEYNGQTLLYEVIDDETCLVARQRNLNGEVTIPETAYYRGKGYTVTEISEYAFDNTGITSVIIPESIEVIDDYAFRNCTNLTKITIGNNVKSFGKGIWSGCPSITEVYYQSMSPVSGPDDMFESSVYEKAMLYLAEEVREEAQKLTPWCNFKHIYRLPGEEYMLIYEYVGSNAKVVGFKPDYEVDVVIPAKVTKDGVEYTVTSIANTAFKNSDLLMSVVIPETIGSIEAEAFANCPRLSRVVYNASNAVCDEKAAESPIFANCSNLHDITIGETVNSIPKYIFKSTPITSIAIPDNVTVLDEGCFGECSELTDITIGSGVKAIRAAAFGLNSYSDKAVTLHFNATNLEEYSGKNGDFGYGTEDLPLVNRNIEKITFGSVVESVCAYALNECKPDTIESYNPVPPVLGVGCLESTDKDTCKLIIPEGSRKAYSLADIWMEFMNVEDTISGIEDVLIDDDTTVKVYNLNGFKIYDGKLSEMTLQNGFYIIIRNGQAKKVYISE